MYKKYLKDRKLFHDGEPLVFHIEKYLVDRKLGMYERKAVLHYLDEDVDLLSLYRRLIDDGCDPDIALEKTFNQLRLVCMYFECVDMEDEYDKENILCH